MLDKNVEEKFNINSIDSHGYISELRYKKQLATAAKAIIINLSSRVLGVHKGYNPSVPQPS